MLKFGSLLLYCLVIGGIWNNRICYAADKCADGEDNCHVNAVCNPIGTTDFTCTCNSGYNGDGTTCADADECAASTSNNCHANADCTNTVGSFTCACKNGFAGSGTSCTDIDECASGQHDCDENADCINTEGSFSCQGQSSINGLAIGLGVTSGVIGLGVVGFIVYLLIIPPNPAPPVNPEPIPGPGPEPGPEPGHERMNGIIPESPNVAIET